MDKSSTGSKSDIHTLDRSSSRGASRSTWSFSSDEDISTYTNSNGADEEMSKSYESYNDKRDSDHFSLTNFVQSQSVRI
jgi:hypothetical protein